MKNNARAVALIVCAVTSSGARAGVVEDSLHSFTGGVDGAYPTGSLLVDSGGKSGKVRALYGTASGGGTSGGGTSFVLVPPHGGSKVWTDTPLWEFTGGVDGDDPLGGLLAETGHISGTTPLYGTTSGYGVGSGTIFSLTGNSLATIWRFTGGSDGAYPLYGVVADKSGALYTSPDGGGASNCGTVIQLVPPAPGQTAWTENTIYSFTGGADGCYANGIVINAKGVLFGTTYAGGTQNDYCSEGGGCGTVFELIPPGNGQTGWTEQTIWSFQGGTDGAAAYAPPTLGEGGVVYGTTAYGGSANCTLYTGCGTVFALTPPTRGSSTWTEQIIAAFSPTGNSSAPLAPVIIDRAGALYGTTSGNFDYSANGTVFRLAPPAPGQSTWTLETVFTFLGGKTGSIPYGPVSADGQGVLYGTTEDGGISGNGNVFSLTRTGFVP